MTTHETYIKRCISIGNHGLGSTAPNPMVGAVIVADDKIIGEGYTSPYGGAHAEVNAVNSVEDKELLKKATLYVTLEPCSHFGKTPPCSDMIIRHCIPKVVIGCVDDNPLVAGRGVEKLRSAGCEVIVGVLEKECKAHLKRFFTYHNKKRPYIILKWAESADGFLSPKQRENQSPVWITNAYSRQLVHKWRSEEQAILVGTKTVLDDNPGLTVRDWSGNHPKRFVIDRDNLLSTDHQIFDSTSKTIRLNAERLNFEEPLAQEICFYLRGQKINSVIIEGGAMTLQTFIDEGLWDEARVFEGKVIFKEGIKAPKFNGQLEHEETIGNDILKYYTP